VTTQLAIPNKRTRFGPKVASRDWWIERNKITKPETRYWTHFTKYQIAQFKALAELDYQVLGERVRTEGAPDSGLAVEYPPKLKEQPFCPTWDYKTFKDFKLWTWLQATKVLDLPINEKNESWYNYFSIKSNQIKAKELLDPFRKEKQKEFDFELQEEYNLVFPTASCISSVQFTVPSGCPFKDLEINKILQVSRLIPLTEAGEHIRKRFIKQYLQERLLEYLALGGLKELIDRRALILTNQQLPAPFYWDLWGNLEHLRNAYQEHLAENLFGPSSKGVEKLSGEAFNGKLLHTRLIQVQDKANMFTWTSILTINGKPLTQKFTKITMEEVIAHAQVYQDRSLREAQNSEMLRWKMAYAS
jgi:hypothetical protein